jgi:hypothetical protein
MNASADDTFSIDVVGESVKRFELGCEGLAKVVGVNVKEPRPMPRRDEKKSAGLACPGYFPHQVTKERL